MLKINNVTKKFKKKIVLDHISIDFDNKIYGLLGPNGSGKTTLFRIITRLISISQGEIENDNINIGYLPQKFGVLGELTVYEMMYYFSSLKRIDKSLRNKEIERVLEFVNLNDEKDKKCSQLSGGMLRRLGIAQAIMGKPDLVLLDEPTVGLDPEERLHFKSIIRKLKGQFPIILSTHIVEDVEALCENIIILNKGRVLFNDAIEQLEKIVENKVYEFPISDLNHIKSDYIKEKYVTQKDGEYMRIILLAEESMDHHVPATIEDGYMYLIKKNEKSS